MLSGDLATLLTGRCIEIKMLPLSFKEFLEITDMDEERGLAAYMRDGGLPYIAVMDRSPEKAETYLEGIYNTVIVKDIEDRQVRKENDPSKKKGGGYFTAKNYRKVSGQRCRKPGFCSEHHGLPDLKWQKDFSQHRE